MKKGNFYICVRRASTGCIEADQVNGYIKDDIGLHKANGLWIATHIPTGLMIRMGVTQKEVIEAAEKLIALAEFETVVSRSLKTKTFAEFDADRTRRMEAMQ